jgi:hypothetical protein
LKNAAPVTGGIYAGRHTVLAMSSRLATIDRLRPRLVAAEAPGPVSVFEAAVMYLYVTSRRSGAGGRTSLVSPAPPRATGDMIVDFDTPAAAVRFRDAVAAHLDPRVWADALPHGIRHCHEINRVHAGTLTPAQIRNGLASAWQHGTQLIADNRAVAPSSPRWLYRQQHAVAAWRALLLAGRPVRRSNTLRIRVPTVEFAGLLVRAARLLRIPARTTHKRPFPILAIDDDYAFYRLLLLVSDNSVDGDRRSSLIDRCTKS